MNPTDRDDEPIVTPVPSPFPTATVDPEVIAEEHDSAPDLPKVNARYIWFMVLAQFGVFMAFITPLAISLSIRVNELAPGREELLGYITGAGALFVMLTAPFMGVWSDRTRTRIGRRRPFMIGGMFVGVISLVVMALAPNVFVLGFGWVLAQWGWGTVLSNLLLAQGRAELDPDARKEIYKQFTEALLDDAPWIFILFRPQAEVMAANVKGYNRITVAGLGSEAYMEYIWIDPDA